MIHELKTWPEYFQLVYDRDKTFEIRKDDRGFKLGDILLLKEFCPNSKSYTGRSCHRTVELIIPGGHFGIEEGYLVMGII